MSDKTRVLILGGGFGGFYAALEFEKRNDPRFEVTVVPARHRGIATNFRIQAKETIAPLPEEPIGAHTP